MSIATFEKGTTATDTKQWISVVELERLEREFGSAALIEGEQVALFRTFDDQIFATSNIDPDTGVSVISRGMVGDKGGRPTISSPLLKACFSLEDGECLTNPELHLATYSTRVVDGMVQISF